MESLYDKLMALNNIENAFDKWAEYRTALTDFICQHASRGDTCLVVGAGACNDLDIASLCSHFSSVTLLDNDARVLNEATKRYRSNHMQICLCDILGVSADSYRQFGNGLMLAISNGSDTNELNRMFLTGMRYLWDTARPEPLPCADTVICCGVHSQLLAMFARMAAVLARYSDLDAEQIFCSISGYNRILQPEINCKLMAAAKNTLILGLEKERIGVTGGIEGAAQALSDLSARGLDMAQRDFIWPFDITQNKIYSMRLCAINNNRQ